MTTLAVAADTVWSGDQSGHLLARDSDSGQVRLDLKAHGDAVTALAAAPDGRLASAGRDGGLAVRDEGGRLLAKARTKAPLLALAWADDGAIFAGGQDGGVTRWRLQDRVLTATPFVPAGGMPVVGLAFGRSLLVLRTSGRLEAYGLDSSLAAGVQAHEAAATALSVDAGGMAAVTADAKGTAVLWRLPGPMPLRARAITGDPIWSAAFLPDGGILLGGMDGRVRVWRPDADAVLVSALMSKESPGMGEGAKLFRRCAACHDLKRASSPKPGPSFHGLIGRQAGTLPAYDYSPALRGSPVVWTEASLDRLLAIGPERFLPGSRMPLQRMSDAAERAALIAYLRRATSEGNPTP